MKYKLIISIISFLLFYNCAKEENNLKRINIDLNEIKNFTAKDIFKNIEVIPLSTNDSCLIGQISKFIYYDNRYYIHDELQKIIFAFDSNGKYIDKIDKVGRGKGEYIRILDFDINQNSHNLEVLSLGKVLKYNTNCQYLGEYKVTNDEIKIVNRILPIDEDKVAFYSFGAATKGIIYSRKNNKIIYKALEQPDYYDFIPRCAFPFYKNGKINTYFESFSNNVYEISKDGFKIKYKWDFGKYNLDINENHANKTPEYYQNLFIKNQDNVASYFWFNFESEKYILTSFNLKGKTILLIYNKEETSYKLIDGYISRILAYSKTIFFEDNILCVCVTPKILKSIFKNDNFFTDGQGQIIESLRMRDNPIILKFQIK